jgi:hypothetical protein
MGAPDVYLRSKVPEDMYDILQKFAEIRKLTRLSFVRDFNLFPETETLLTLERKYGDSLNYEDLHGKPGEKKKKKGDPDQASQVGSEETKKDDPPKDLNATQNSIGSKKDSKVAKKEGGPQVKNEKSKVK